MRVVIEDSYFPAGTRIHIGGGSDALSFVRCTFEGGEIAVDAEVRETIFRRCLFLQTRFSGQTLSDRIAVDCTNPSVATEASAPQGSKPFARFRR